MNNRTYGERAARTGIFLLFALTLFCFVLFAFGARLQGAAAEMAPSPEKLVAELRASSEVELLTQQLIQHTKTESRLQQEIQSQFSQIKQQKESISV